MRCARRGPDPPTDESIRPSSSIVVHSTPPAFGLTPAAFGLPASPLGGPPPPAPPRPAVPPIAFLGAVAAGLDPQDSVTRRPTPRQLQQPDFHRLRQRSRPPHVEPQPHRRGDLVDVLAARSGGAERLELYPAGGTSCS